MCGISGSFNHKGIINREICASMHNLLIHRGPDETYSLNLHSLAVKLARLGMNGLKDGWQPANDASTRFISMTNGEIYNAKKIYDELDIKMPLENHVDVAIIPELIAKYGINGLEKIDGQFASVIYDKQSNRIYLARDRFGICPIYFTQLGDCIHFCSELRPLVKTINKLWRINYKALDQYFSLGNIVAPQTIISDVYSVEPGCVVEFSDSEQKNIRYWRYGEFAFEDNSYDYRLLRNNLKDSIYDRLQSDVKIGSYLSGGFDSSAILVDATQIASNPICSFSAVFDDPSIDESSYQKEVARTVGSVHEEIFCSKDEISLNFERMVRFCCSPQRETYNVAACLLSKGVKKKGIKGVLSGEGADELFFGYDSYLFDSINRSRVTSLENEQAWGRADFAWEVNQSKYLERKKLYLSDKTQEQILGNEFWRTRLIPFSEEELVNFSRMQLRSIADVYIQLSGHLLGDHGDMMLMANSIEGRYPFLSNSVVALALKTPDDKKVVDFEGKQCLRRAYVNHIPDIVLNRSKYGFTSYDLRTITSATLWNDWKDLVASTNIFNKGCLDNSVNISQMDKYDFTTSIISISIIIDELGLLS